MGSFNTSCMVSGLPIRDRQKVKLFFLEQRASYPTCYATDAWQPITGAIDGVYDDYNNYELDETQENFQLLLEYISANGVKREQGENKYREIAVDPDNLDANKLFEALHDGRLKTKCRYFNESEDKVVAVAAIHEKVYEELMKMTVIHWYGDCTLESLVAKQLKEYDEKWNEFNDLEVEALKAAGDEEEQVRMSMRAVANMTYGELIRRESVVVSYDIRNTELSDKETGHRVIRSIAKQQFLDMVLNESNRAWSPVQTSGQDIEHANQIAYHQACIAGIKADHDEYIQDEF